MRTPIATLLAVLLFAPALAQAAQTVAIEDMTWMEVRDAMKAGKTTIIIPTGGTEQNGPQIVEGKHNFIVAYTSQEIARRLGDALVAPVIAYVPEGRINPPEGHMKFPGTISVGQTTFAAVLEDTARSFKQHGFRLICFVGDHGGSQEAQKIVADKLNAEWGEGGPRVLNVGDYYAKNGQKEWAAGAKIKAPDIEAHAGFADTAETLALRPGAVRKELISNYGPEHYLTGGVAGDPREATPAYGQKLLALKIEAAVKQIQNAELRH